MSLYVGLELAVRALFIFSIVFVIYYFFIIPRPIRGIPVGKSSSIHPLGDIPALIRHFKRCGSVFNFVTTRCSDYGSPIVQLLLGDSAFVVVGDLRETHDVALRRNRDFGHAIRQDKTFQMIAKNATISMPSHANFWAQRKIWSGVMSTSFLHEVAAPHIHRVSIDLFRLWHRKSSLGADRYAFDCIGDINDMLMDSLWAMLVGRPMGILEDQRELLENSDTAYLPDSSSRPVTFPTRNPPAIATACRKLIDTVDPFLMSPAPNLQRWLLTLTPSFRKAQALKAAAMAEILETSRSKYANATDPDDVKPECAIDYVFSRTAHMKPSQEKAQAMSDGHLEDEMFMFLVAGLNTTSLALTWGLKYLSDNPLVQSRLRKETIDSFGKTGQTTPPTAERILGTICPYLEATIWETLRMCQAVPTIIRQAERDTELLGHQIPQGTPVMFALEGESLVYDQDFDILEGSRSASSKVTRARWPRPWSAQDKRKFIPERWLRRGEDGNEVFDSRAGPNLPFGVGARSCYGQKLVMVLLRLFFVLAVWSSEFLQVPEELAAYKMVEVLTRKPKHGYVQVRSLID